jgi:hypothetical protein
LSPWGLPKYGGVSKRFFYYGRFLIEVQGSGFKGSAQPLAGKTVRTIEKKL